MKPTAASAKKYKDKDKDHSENTIEIQETFHKTQNSIFQLYEANGCERKEIQGQRQRPFRKHNRDPRDFS